MASMTTIKVSTRTRDRLRELAPDGTFDDAVNAICDEAERQRRREIVADSVARSMTHHREALDRLAQ